MKPITHTLALALLPSLLLAACGGGGSGQSAAAATTTTSTPTTSTTPGSTTSAIDPTRIPVGDGKVTTTTPQVGYVYACTIPTSSNPAGKAPWISADGSTWDASAKVMVSGSVTWVSTFSSNLANGLLSLIGNGLPSHTTGTFPIAASDPAHAYDGNPNSIRASSIAWGLPGNPTVAANPSCTSLGAIGVMLSGSRLYNALDADGRDAAAHEVQDACGGHPQGAGVYHYHSLPTCLTLKDVAGQHSPLVGYIADGFGIYGNQGENGKALTNADLDACHGHTHAITIDGQSVTQYHYHTTREYPYTVGCYKGTPVQVR